MKNNDLLNISWYVWSVDENMASELDNVSVELCRL